MEFLWREQRVNVVVHSCWGNYGGGEGAVLLCWAPPEHPQCKYPWTNTAEVLLMCSQPCQLLAEIPFRMQPQHGFGVSSPWDTGMDAQRDRSRGDVSDWELFMSCRANNSDWLSGQGCLSESLKGPFWAEDGKKILNFSTGVVKMAVPS